MGKTVLFALLAISVCLAEKIQESDWKTGVLLEQSSERESRIVGHISNGNGSVVQQHHVYAYYTIDAGEMLFVAVRHTHAIWDKPLKVTVNAPIKYAIKGRDMYLMDEDGKTHKLSIDQKILKTKPREAAESKEKK